MAGSASINIVLAETKAYLTEVTVNVDGNVSIKANDKSEIWSVAGAGSYGDKAGFGAAVSLNLIGFSTLIDAVPNRPGKTQAYIENSTVTIRNGTLEISAGVDNPTVDPRIVSATGTVGIGAKQESIGLAGMLSVNVVKTVTEAFVKNSTIVEKPNDPGVLTVKIHAKGRIINHFIGHRHCSGRDGRIGCGFKLQ